MCTFDPDRLEDLPRLRPDHLAHVDRHRSVIAFGGVIGGSSRPPTGICYVLDVAEPTAAQSFADQDPYAPVYRDVRVEPFSQRLPAPEPQEAS